MLCNKKNLGWATDDSGSALLKNYILTLNHALCLQCFDTVGWVAGRASGL